MDGAQRENCRDSFVVPSLAAQTEAENSALASTVSGKFAVNDQALLLVCVPSVASSKLPSSKRLACAVAANTASDNMPANIFSLCVIRSPHAKDIKHSYKFHPRRQGHVSAARRAKIWGD